MQVVVLSNRGDRYVHDAIRSLRQDVTGWDQIVIVDDSGDRAHRAQMAATYPDARVVAVSPQPAGYGRAMSCALTQMTGEYALFWEEDFRATRPIHLPDVVAHLDADEHLAQVALLRGPWFANEHAHGGVIEARQAEGAVFTPDGPLIRHIDHFTGNPSVLPRRTFTRPWPSQAWSESAFGHQLVADGFTFAYLAGVAVEHVGVRDGHGY